MILSELIGSPVVEGGRRVGRVTDVRFVLDGPLPDAKEAVAQPVPDARVYGILVSPRPQGSFLGYERSGVTSPWPLAQLLRRRQRGSYLVFWDDIGELSSDGVVLRPAARRWSPALHRPVSRHSGQRQN